VVLLATLAPLLPLAARQLAGPPGVLVHVRWDETVDDAGREMLESRFRLLDGERLDERTWRYDLVDPSRDNIRALIESSAVEDTHHIDRPNYSAELTAATTARRGRFPAYGQLMVTMADVLAATFAAAAFVITAMGLFLGVPPLQALRLAFGHAQSWRERATRRIGTAAQRIPSGLTRPLVAAARFVERGIPEIDASTAGLFRIVFGLVLLGYFAWYRVDSSWLNDAFDPEIEGAVHAFVIEWLRGRPVVADLVTPWLLTFGTAFTLGLFTRLSYTLFVIGVIGWAYLAMSIESTHPHAALVLTLVALLPSRWGDARSLDSWRHRISRDEGSQTRRSLQYGYTVWVPTLTFGVTFAAAAWAKLTVPASWTTWILNGSIKYHIVSDSAGAPLDWGLELLRYPALAVAVSFGAVAIEALVLTAAFVRDERYKLAMGVAATALFAGIGLLMGIAWPGWWIPLLGFLPWQRWSTRFQPIGALPPIHAPNRLFTGRTLTALQFAFVAGVAGQQLVVSALRVERAPMFSWYDMYSRSYSGPEDFNASIAPEYQIFVESDRGRVQLRCSPHEEFVRDFSAALSDAVEPRARVWRSLRGCGADLSNVRSVTLEGRVRKFDWDRLEFTSTYSLTQGPLTPDREK
jgi:hypothetical protein